MKLNIGENIRSSRRRLDMTQEQLADRIGVSYQSVSRWENGLTYPDMELIPALAEIFGISTDELFGMENSQKEKEAEKTLGELIKVSREKEPPVEKIKELIRKIRRDYLECSCFSEFWFSVNQSIYFHKEILTEVRLTAEAILESNLSIFKKNIAIENMAVLEDEERLQQFLKRYASDRDLSRPMLLKERYIRRGEYEKNEPVRQLLLYRCIDQIIGGEYLYRDYSKAPDLNERMMISDFQTGFLNLLCGSESEEEADFLVRERLWIKFRRSCRLASLGKKNEGLAELENAVSLLEKVMKITEPVELGCSSPFLKGFKWRAWEDWVTSDSYLIDTKEERTVFIESVCNDLLGGCWLYVIYPSQFLEVLTTSSDGWKWFDPIREEPRYKECVKRIEKLVIYRDKEN